MLMLLITLVANVAVTNVDVTSLVVADEALTDAVINAVNDIGLINSVADRYLL